MLIVEKEVLEAFKDRPAAVEFIRAGKLEAIKESIQKRELHVNDIVDFPFKKPLLLLAVINCQFEIVQFLVENGANVNARGYWKPDSENEHHVSAFSALEIALELGEELGEVSGEKNNIAFEIAVYLMSKGAFLNHISYNQRRSLEEKKVTLLNNFKHTPVEVALEPPSEKVEVVENKKTYCP